MTIRTVGNILILAIAALLAACSSKESEVTPVVTVQVSDVKQDAISALVSADAVLFPVNQATIVPKLA
jgi:uncharacterized protein (DUF2141 family)